MFNVVGTVKFYIAGASAQNIVSIFEFAKDNNLQFIDTWEESGGWFSKTKIWLKFRGNERDLYRMVEFAQN